MKPIRVTAPTSLPVSRVDVKLHARIEHEDDDQVLASMINAAVALLDGYKGLLGRAIMQQTWRQPFAGWAGVLILPMPDVRNVVVKYTDQDGAEQTVSNSLYELIETHAGPVVRFLSGFTAPSLKTDIAQPVRVEFTAGAESAAAVDDRIKQAIYMLITHWDANRGVMTAAREAKVPWGVELMIAPLRWRVLA